MSQPIALPLPHAWLEADTRLPTARYHTERNAHIHPLRVLAARLAGYRSSSPVAQGSGNVLDGAQRSFDAYFDVVRADGQPLVLLRTAMANTLMRAFEDVLRGTTLTEEQLARLAIGLHRIADWVLTPTAIDLEATADLVADGAPIDPLDRWRTHHQVFFVMVHAMLYLLHVLEEALDREHAPVVRAILADFTDVMRGSAEVFRQAADFSVDAYNDVIRPDMAAHDPHFSGLFYADHKELVTSLRILRRVGSDFQEELSALGEALDEVYVVHALVCEHFVGRAPSLANTNLAKVGPDSLRGKYLSRSKVMAGIKTHADPGGSKNETLGPPTTMSN